MSSPICKNQRRINAAVIACRPTWNIRIDSAHFRHHRFSIGSIGEPSSRSTVAPLNLDFRVLSSVLTHISCVAVRAVSFGASASFGSARLSVRPPVLFAFSCDRLVPKGVRHRVGGTERKYPSTTFPRDNLSWDKSCLYFRLHTCGHPNRHVSRRPLPHRDRRRPARCQ